MLAATQVVTPQDLYTLPLPMWGTPKFDGIRAQKFPKGLMSRKHINIPNMFIEEWADESDVPNGFDGELIVWVDEPTPGRKGKTTRRMGTFNECQSKIMSKYTMPFSWTYYVFDKYININERQWEYRQRLHQLQRLFDAWGAEDDRCELVLPVRLGTVDQIIDYEREQVEQKGFEGIILRKGSSEYKHGRATFNEATFLKMKRFDDHEAIITGFEERMMNLNEKKRDNLGNAKRSKHKANLVGMGMVGTIVARDIESGKRIHVGSGFNHALAKQMWENQHQYVGRIFTYKSQIHGEKDLPRAPIFKGFRHD